MGSDDIFKKRREGRKKRKHEYKKPKANSYLIVTEGQKTEPNYFKGIKEMIEANTGGNVDVIEVPIIEIHGEGCSTMALIEVTDKIINQSTVLYQNVWLLFDKDDFMDFDEAIVSADSRGYRVAWSNQSFEYWLFLHFNYSDAALHRDEWVEKLNFLFKQFKINGGNYSKNDLELFEHVNKYGGMETAIKNAKRRMSEYDQQTMKPSGYDPGTTVHELVEELKQFMYD